MSKQKKPQSRWYSYNMEKVWKQSNLRKEIKEYDSIKPNLFHSFRSTANKRLRSNNVMIDKTTMQVERMNQYFGWGQSAKNQAHVYARDLELDESVHIAKLFN